MSGRRRGFTLVELLAVIGIISALIAVLLPVLGRAREQARTVNCQSNIRQILMAMHMYANENGVLPIPCDAGDNRILFFGVIDAAYAQYSYTDGTLMPYIANSPEIRQRVFTCPSDDLTRLGASPTGNYSYNSSARLNRWTSHMYMGVKSTQIAHCWNKILVLEEQNPTRAGDEPVQFVSSVPPPYPTLYKLTKRHQGLANEGFADGHVGTMRPSDFPDLLTVPGQMAYGKYVVLTSDAYVGRP